MKFEKPKINKELEQRLTRINKLRHETIQDIMKGFADNYKAIDNSRVNFPEQFKMNTDFYTQFTLKDFGLTELEQDYYYQYYNLKKNE